MTTNTNTKKESIQEFVNILHQTDEGSPEKIAMIISVLATASKKSPKRAAEIAGDLPRYIDKYTREQYQATKDMLIRHIENRVPEVEEDKREAVLEVCQDSVDFIDKHFLARTGE